MDGGSPKTAARTSKLARSARVRLAQFQDETTHAQDNRLVAEALASYPHVKVVHHEEALIDIGVETTHVEARYTLRNEGPASYHVVALEPRRRDRTTFAGEVTDAEGRMLVDVSTQISLPFAIRYATGMAEAINAALVNVSDPDARLPVEEIRKALRECQLGKGTAETPLLAKVTEDVLGLSAALRAQSKAILHAKRHGFQGFDGTAREKLEAAMKQIGDLELDVAALTALLLVYRHHYIPFVVLHQPLQGKGDPTGKDHALLDYAAPSHPPRASFRSRLLWFLPSLPPKMLKAFLAVLGLHVDTLRLEIPQARVSDRCLKASDGLSIWFVVCKNHPIRFHKDNAGGFASSDGRSYHFRRTRSQLLHYEKMCKGKDGQAYLYFTVVTYEPISTMALFYLALLPAYLLSRVLEGKAEVIPGGPNIPNLPEILIGTLISFVLWYAAIAHEKPRFQASMPLKAATLLLVVMGPFAYTHGPGILEIVLGADARHVWDVLAAWTSEHRIAILAILVSYVILTVTISALSGTYDRIMALPLVTEKVRPLIERVKDAAGHLRRKEST